MENLFAIGVTNAAVTTVLAIVVWCVTRIWRQPPLAHVLWVLVLVKLVTPPFVTIPWQLESLAARSDASTIAADSVENTPTTAPTSAAVRPQTLPQDRTNDALLLTERTFDLAEANAFERKSIICTNHAGGKTREPVRWATLLLSLWLVGSAAWLLIAIVRLARFHRALSNTMPCPADVCRLAEEAAAKIGVTGRFQLRMTEARLSPFVWPIGRPTIVLSRPMLAEMPGDETETLLAHELAHLRRKDHWLRWFELFVTAAYWWHPVVWWSRHMIRQAEEQACDAWVLWAFPDAARRYASALFKAVQMVS